MRGKHGDIGGEGVNSRGRQTLPGLSYAEYGNIERRERYFVPFGAHGLGTLLSL